MIFKITKGDIAPQYRTIFLSRVKELIPIVSEEKGCIQFEAYSDATDTNKFLLFEVWEDQRFLTNQRSQSYMKHHFDTLSRIFPKGVERKLYKIKSCEVISKVS